MCALYYQNVANDVVLWGIDAWFGQDQLKRLFEMAGYDINNTLNEWDKMPDIDQINLYPSFPVDGYIYKIDDCYVVNLK